MQVKNCPRCGRLFTEIKSPICPECEKAEEDAFQRVREYIDENEMSTLQEISDAAGVSPKKIMQYIKDGRLEISKGMSGALRCENCGKPISKGRFCDKCLLGLKRDINVMFGKEEHDEPGEKQKEKMHSSLMNKKL
ncbi:MAG: MerR family transcriptional regulator [Defluviitaleaceae bacterium]|nr:MerR family transcriptional regulator [Defluviitaleaceae bacterium]